MVRQPSYAFPLVDSSKTQAEHERNKLIKHQENHRIGWYFVQLPIVTVLAGDTLHRLVVGGSDGADWLRWVTCIQVKSDLTSFSNSSAIIQNKPSVYPRE
jgi:hypothetical protein